MTYATSRATRLRSTTIVGGFCRFITVENFTCNWALPYFDLL